MMMQVLWSWRCDDAVHMTVLQCCDDAAVVILVDDDDDDAGMMMMQVLWCWRCDDGVSMFWWCGVVILVDDDVAGMMMSMTIWLKDCYTMFLTPLSGNDILCLCHCILPDRSCYHDVSWTAWTISMQLTGNLAPWFWRSKVKVTSGCWCAEGIHINTWALKSI